MKRSVRILLILVVLAGPLLALLLQISTPKTGDELVDLLASMLRKHGPDRDRLYESLREHSDEFADDPRYWQLLATYRPMGVPASREFFELSPNADILEGLKHGAADPATYSLINLHGVAATEPARAKELADQAIASDPENALFHYRKAELLLALGDHQAALKAVRRGNELDRIESPISFPMSEIDASPELVPKVISYRSTGSFYLFDGSASIAFKDVHRDIVEGVKAGSLDLAIADEFYTSIVRRCQAANASLMDLLILSVGLGFYLDPKDVASISISQERQAYAAELAKKRKAIVSKFRTFTSMQGPPPPSLALRLRKTLDPEEDDWKWYWEHRLTEKKFVESLQADLEDLLPSPYAKHTN